MEKEIINAKTLLHSGEMPDWYHWAYGPTSNFDHFAITLETKYLIFMIGAKIYPKFSNIN